MIDNKSLSQQSIKKHEYWLRTKQAKNLRKICSFCNQQFNTWDYRQLCCSRICAGKMRALKEGKQLKIKIEHKKYLLYCQRCNVEIQSKLPYRKWCFKCRKEINLESAKRKSKERYIIKPFKITKCIVCNKEIKYKGEIRLYCKTCRIDIEKESRKTSNRIRRKRLNGVIKERISKKIIYERDNGKCQICYKKININKKYPNPLSMTLDHIIPLACGGNHIYSNLQLAHLKCNYMIGIKGEKQLRLN